MGEDQLMIRSLARNRRSPKRPSEPRPSGAPHDRERSGSDRLGFTGQSNHAHPRNPLAPWSLRFFR